MLQPLPIKSQLSTHLLVFIRASNNAPSTESNLLNSRGVQRMEFGLPHFKRSIHDQGHLVSTEKATEV